MAIALPVDQIPVISKTNPPSGETDYNAGVIILIDKPKGWTSFDVVNYIRKRIDAKKVGHAGTLDPMATGLLVLCAGKATKSISQIQEMKKVYEGEVTFGGSTPSYDAEEDVDETAEFGHITEKQIKEVLEKQFSGEIQQVPPMYSALKYGGKKLYELARKGKEVKRVPRSIVIYEHEVINYDPPKLELLIKCSKGTYIRSIAHDLGLALESRGHLSALKRTFIGEFSTKNAFTPHEFGDLLSNIKNG